MRRRSTSFRFRAIAVPLDHALGDDLAHVLALGQLVHAGGEHVVEGGEAAAQGLGHARADVQDAQPEQQPPQVALLAGGDAVEEVPGGLLAHAFEARHLGQLERIEVRHVAHEAALDELAHEDFAAAFDVHRAARAPMFEAPAHLGRAIRIQAAPDDAFVALDDPGRARDLGAALGAGRRESGSWLPCPSAWPTPRPRPPE